MTRPLEVHAPTIVTRASLEQSDDVHLLLDEYYAEVGVIERDTPQDVVEYLSKSDSGFWIAYSGGVPAGCVALRPLEAMRNAGECKRLYVRERFRRRGIAAVLMDALEHHAKRLSLSWVYLDSEDRLESAIALYRARGYAACERYNDNIQATVFMRKHIERS